MLKQGDCNNILTSEYSQLLGIISWAEIGFSYFVFNLLVILLNPSWVRYLCIMNLFTLPYTFWSIWYQKYKMKTWCILCLSVQCILGSYFITGGCVQGPDANFPWNSLRVLCFPNFQGRTPGNFLNLIELRKWLTKNIIIY